MAVDGVHALIHAEDAERARTFFRDVLELEWVDAGDGWLIFALPPAELGIHPTHGGVNHELYLMCDDIRGTVEQLAAKGAQISGEIRDEGFGLVASIAVPGAADIALYEPRHPAPRAEPHADQEPGTPAAWHEFERSAPELAAAVRDRFEAHLHHILGTIRPDGSPQLSGIEVRIEQDEVTVGMMAGSQKLSDVQRDPRVELHSAPLDTEPLAGDAKLAGSLIEHGPAHEAPGTSFRLRITLAGLVRVEDNELVLTTWRPGRGVRENRRE